MADVGLLLFSGGVDSTYIAARVAPLFDRLRLVTYRTPGMVRVEASRHSVEQLRTLHGDHIEHEIIDLRHDVRRLRGGFRQCLADNVRYRFFYAWCLGCKLTMHTHTLSICLRDHVHHVLDGSNAYDAHALEQHPEIKARVAALYQRHGIEYTSPYYLEHGALNDDSRLRNLLREMSLLKDSTEVRVEHLRQLGFDCGPGVMSQYRAHQPSCLVSPVFNLPRVPLKLVFDEKAGDYLAYVDALFRRAGWPIEPDP